MTLEEFEAKFDNFEFYDEYSEFIMNNYHKGNRIICNGNALVIAIEDNYLYEQFKQFILEGGNI